MILITHLECTGIIVIVDGKKIHTCHIVDIHYDDMPYLYFTIKYENKEVQTSISNLSYQ